MGFYTYLKGLISSKIKANGKGAISGDILQEELLRVIDSLTCFKLVGLANTKTNPSPGDEPLMYLADGKGTFTNFSNLEVTEDVCFLCWTSQAWVKVGISVPDGLLEVSEDNLCSVTISIDSLDYTDENVYFFWSSPTEDYVMYMDNGQEPPVISGRTTMGLKSIDTSVFTLNLNVFGFTLTNNQSGSCKSEFSVETFSTFISSIDNVKDYITVSPINKYKLLISDILDLQKELDSKVDILPENSEILHVYKLNSLTVQWEDGWVKLPTKVYPVYCDIKNIICVVKTTIGFTELKIRLCNKSTSSKQSPLEKFIYIRDEGDILNKYSNFSSIFISFELHPKEDQSYTEFGLLEKIVPSNNVLFTGFDSEHDNNCKNNALQFYPEFPGEVLIAADDPTLSDGDGTNSLYTWDYNFLTYCKEHNIDLVCQEVGVTFDLHPDPEPGIPLSAKVNSPDVLVVTGHFFNWEVEHNNGLESDDQFFDGLILINGCTTTLIPDLNHPDGLATGSYGRGMEFTEDLSQYNPVSAKSTAMTGSYAMAIIALKLKMIKLAVNASWHEVRIAARATASNNGVWNKRTGFGVIDYHAAIAYIEANYTTASVEIGNRYSEDKGYSDKLDYKHIHDNTPVPKGLMEKYIQDAIQAALPQ